MNQTIGQPSAFHSPTAPATSAPWNCAPPITIHPRRLKRLLLEAFAQQIAFALDRLRLNQLSERARLLQESERLSKTLLDSMSHELRTPISAIQSATSNLLELGHDGLTKFQREMIAEINEANERLHRLVGNTLEINRLESGPIKPALIESNVGELVTLCLTEIERRFAQHRWSSPESSQISRSCAWTSF